MYKSNWTQKCEYYRAIPLETVLRNDGAKQDIHDRKKWHTIQGSISITGPEFFNWHCNYGGGGAIDLVMHLKDCDFSTAIAWLSTVTPSQLLYEKRSNHYPQTRNSHTYKKLLLPAKNTTHLPRITSYLIQERKLPQHLIYRTIESGSIYADTKANAVFLMRGACAAIVGAELRGTIRKKWRGLAPGSDKQRGAFYTGSPSFKTVSLCESAIDALSYVTLYPNTLAISTTGANPHLQWIENFIKNDFRLLCAFDNDNTGNQMADKILNLYPMIKRHCPWLHDWNDILKDKM
jgi:hypothetical protein